MRTSFSKRLRFITFCVVAFALLLSSKLYQVQIVQGEVYSTKADRQYLRHGGLTFDRGSIFFETRDKKLVSAATLQNGFIVAINPSLIKDAEFVYQKLNDILPVNREEFFFKAGKPNDPYEEIAKQVDNETAKKIENLNIDGLNIYRDRWRFYPGSGLAANVIGFTGWENEKIAGLYGLERYYNDTLSRNQGEVYVNFFAEIFSNINSVINLSKKQREGDLITTIEPTVQMHLERELMSVASKWDTKEVAGIIMDPKTGEIRAMAVYPSFDVNNFKSVRDPYLFTNPLVENVYEMGSIIKPLTIAAGIDAGVIEASTTYNDQGYIILDSARISNHDKRARGVVSMQEVLSQSLNTGVAFITKKLGKTRFADYMKSFGLGEETGIDLPNEVRGLISNLNSPREVEYATASFGQGIALTPIATVRALAALGNGGELVTPHVVKKIDYKSGFSTSLYLNENVPILKKETSEEITRMLVEVVDKALLGGSVKIENYSIAAKTGTAQIPDPRNGGYHDDKYLHSFFGYFPAYKPEYIIFLYAIEPKANYASETLTHPFMNLTKYLINYYNLPPDR
jgi:stage V sporulation protein D (sporulation-specific penicillin-binding protein)